MQGGKGSVIGGVGEWSWLPFVGPFEVTELGGSETGRPSVGDTGSDTLMVVKATLISYTIIYKLKIYFILQGFFINCLLNNFLCICNVKILSYSILLWLFIYLFLITMFNILIEIMAIWFTMPNDLIISKTAYSIISQILVFTLLIS